MYVYRVLNVAGKRKTKGYEVGFFSPSGVFHRETEYKEQWNAALRVHFLNGGSSSTAPVNADLGND